MCLGMENGVQQTTLDGFTTCKDCLYGRDVLGGQYACRSDRRRQEGKKLVNKADYTCGYAERKFIK